MVLLFYFILLSDNFVCYLYVSLSVALLLQVSQQYYLTSILLCCFS